MEESKLSKDFVEMNLMEQTDIDGGVVPALVFLGKVTLAAIGYGIGYWGVDALLN